jgi:outer membrane immunogenic protein
MPFNWGGLYIGINGGYGFGASRFTDGDGDTTGDFDINGWVVGGTVGYNWQSGRFVLGVEGDIDWSGISGTTAANCSGCVTKNDWLGTARLRLGYAMDRWLPYVTGGVAFGDINGGPAGTSTEAGWTAGAGVEWALQSNWSAKLEYLYVGLHDGICATPFCDANGGTIAFHTNLVRAGLNYRF